MLIVMKRLGPQKFLIIMLMGLTALCTHTLRRFLKKYFKNVFCELTLDTYILFKHSLSFLTLK